MGELLKKTDVLVQTTLIFLIQIYRVGISPHFGSCCRFYPTCSVYAQQSIRIHGVVQGTFLTFLRLLKCQPLHPGGVNVIESRT